ncbi:hypothetical protein D3C71_1751490 [compost metagenome]
MFHLRFAAQLLHERLIVLGELVPRDFRNHQQLRDDQVVGLRVVLGAGAEVIAGEEAGGIILSTVHHTGLQRGEHLSVTHRDAVAAHGVHGVHKQRIAHHADLLALEVSRRAHGFFGVQAA